MKISFTKIDNNLIVDKAIDSNTFRVYAYIISLYNEERGYSFPSIRTISDKLGISTPTIQKAIKKLKELSYIVVEQIKSNSNNTMNVYKKLKHLIQDHQEPKKESNKPLDGQISVNEVPSAKFNTYKNTSSKVSKFNNYPQRDYDWSTLEDELLGFDID